MAYKDTLKFEKRVKKEPPPAAAPRFSYFIVAALVYYNRDSMLKQRHINLLAQLPENEAITRPTLTSLNGMAISRITAENDVQMTDIKDVVFTSMTFLGTMTEAQFAGPEETLVDPTPELPA